MMRDAAGLKGSRGPSGLAPARSTFPAGLGGSNRLLSAFTAFYRLSVVAGGKQDSKKTNQCPERFWVVRPVSPGFARFRPVFREGDLWGG